MSKPIIKIHNAETGEIVEREMNTEELAQWKIDQETTTAAALEKAAKDTEKTALLAKLGITEDEARLLIG